MSLAVEEAIPRKVGEGTAPNTIRFWRSANAVVVGRFQSTIREANLKACKKQGTTIIRRFTGGGAVYHDHGNLNYAISLRKHHSLVSGDLSQTFKALSLGVIEGLRTLGLRAAEFKPINSIQIDGRKVSGAAGSLRWGTVFFHGSVLVSSNISVLSRVLKASEDKVTTLSDELGKTVSIKEAKEALIKGFERVYKIKLVKGGLTEEEEELAKTLCEKKYLTEEWNLGKQHKTYTTKNDLKNRKNFKCIFIIEII